MAPDRNELQELEEKLPPKIKKFIMKNREGTTATSSSNAPAGGTEPAAGASTSSSAAGAAAGTAAAGESIGEPSAKRAKVDVEKSEKSEVYRRIFHKDEASGKLPGTRDGFGCPMNKR